MDGRSSAFSSVAIGPGYPRTFNTHVIPLVSQCFLSSAWSGALIDHGQRRMWSCGKAPIHSGWPGFVGAPKQKSVDNERRGIFSFREFLRKPVDCVLARSCLQDSVDDEPCIRKRIDHGRKRATPEVLGHRHITLRPGVGHHFRVEVAAALAGDGGPKGWSSEITTHPPGRRRDANDFSGTSQSSR